MATTTASNSSGVAQPADHPGDGSGVAQPAPTSLHLGELNSRSAKLGCWDIGCFKPRIDEWSWQDKTTHQTKQGAAFRCLLVSMRNPSEYTTAQLNMRGNNKGTLEAAMQRFSANTAFRMSKVQFQSNAQQEYLHTPLKFVVQIQGSKFDPIMKKNADQIVQPEPSMTLSEIKELTKHQRFDVTALVTSVGEPKDVRQDRCPVDITIMDDSAIDYDVQELKWTYWVNTKPNSQESATIDILRDCEGNNKPLSFFGFEGKKTERGFQVQNSKEFFVVEAVGSRAKKLAEVATTLKAAPHASRATIENLFAPNEGGNFEEVPGVQTFCQILKSMDSKTDIPTMDDMPTVWQLVWTEVAWPQGEHADLCTKDGERLFPETFLMDATGSGPRVRMTEESVLSLAQVATKQEFLDIHAAGKQTFPAMASLKIVRRVNTKSSDSSHFADTQSSESSQFAEKRTYVNFVVVQAVDQPLGEMPTKAVLELVPLMPQLNHDSACIIAAPLQLIKVSAHYAFQVRIPNGVVLPCQKILTVIKSTKASKLVNIGQGYKIVTSDIEDFLASDVSQLAAESSQKFTVSSTCTLDNLSSYRMDPPRGGAQYALVTITGKADDVYVVELVQLLSPADAVIAKNALLKLLSLAIEINTSKLKRSAPWTAQDSPAKAKKCKVLGRCPTSEPLDEPFS